MVTQRKKSTRPSDGPPGMDVLPSLKAMGVSVFDPIWAAKVHQSTYSELLCVVHGALTLDIEGQRTDLRPGDVALVAPHMPHRDDFEPGTEPEIFLAQFQWDAEAAFFAEVHNAAIAALPAHHRGELLRIILELRDHSLSEAAMDKTYANALLHALLLRIWRAVRKTAVTVQEHQTRQDRRRHLMTQARQYLDTHFHEVITLDSLAEKLDVSPYYLSRVFSRESGFSLIAYLTAVRMRRARELLSERVGNVSEVAYAVGYENGAYFSRVFKRHFGLSPSAVACRPPPPRR